MYAAPVAHPQRRFLKTLGYSLVQALLFGSLVGSLVYFRVPRTDRSADADENQPWHQRLRNRLEDVELWFYDWRARELGESSVRSDKVVMVGIDEEAVANARKDEHPGISIQPWPREIIGGVVDRLVAEGASLVVVDLPFADESPSSCPNPEIVGAQAASDDDALRTLLERHPGQAVLGFAWSAEKAPVVATQPKPFLVLLNDRGTAVQAREQVRRVLSERHPAYVIPSGQHTQIWAGVASEEEARAFARPWESRNGATREFAPTDRAFQMTAQDLLVSLSEVKVDGIDVNALPHVRSLRHPIAPLLSDKALFGSATLRQDMDGRVRGISHLMSYAGADGVVHVLPSIPLIAAMHLAESKELRYVSGRLHVGQRFSIPMDESGYSLIQWDAPEAAKDHRGSLKRSVSAWRVVVNLFDKIQGVPPHYRNDLEGRVAVLTNTSSYATDFDNTPIGTAAGAAVLGQALGNLLDSRSISRVSPWVDLISTGALAFLGAFLALTFGTGFRSFTGALVHFLSVPIAGGAFLWVARRVFVENHLWIAVAGALLAMAATFLFTTLYAYETERRLLDFIRSALGRSLNANITSQVISDLTLMRPERRLMTICFADVESFSALADSLSPEQIVELLNDYLTEMTGVIRRQGGQIDKYVGDSITAFWGAPLRTDRHAHQACEAAISMRERLLEKQPEWERRYGRRIEFRIGLNTGEMVVGDMGTELKSNYTVIGDAVSLAWRLERENRYYGTFMLVGEATARAAADEFLFREVDRVRVRGRSIPIQILELVSRRSRKADKPEQLLLFEQALLAYHQRRFLEALDLFNRCHTEFGDALASVYVRRCDHYLDAPPPEVWDGVFELTA